ncbi:MAG TPA: maleylpyruvate isomerase family mycothiol-dependent enzyme [Mycobacteriales bacterium]|nr:maleylpyruvate isomerase family mycothiol-dependent enzyme [Mycobacteriales bacterium]
MTPDEHIAAISRHAEQLGADAAAAGLDASLPTCPGWSVRDVVTHLGGVHRWATTIVADGLSGPPGGDLERPVGDEELLDWFRQGHERLVKVLTKADDTLDCWSFLPAPYPRAFWARRQAHETAIHRADVASANGGRPEFSTAFGVDGLDELLLGFFARRGGKLLADPPVALALRATDAGPTDAWTMRIGPQGREVDRGHAHGDLLIEGPASDLYQLMWNRRSTAGLELTGDDAVLELWREKARVTWS